MNRANFDPHKRGCDNRGSTIGSSFVSRKDATRLHSDSRDHVEQANQLSGPHNPCHHFALYPEYLCTRGRSRASRDLDKTECGQQHLTICSRVNRCCSNRQEARQCSKRSTRSLAELHLVCTPLESDCYLQDSYGAS